MSVSLFLLLLVCAVLLAIYMVGTVGMTASLTDLTFMLSVMCTLLTALSTYVFCFFSENVTNDLHSIGDAFYQANWYAHPAKQQKLYMLSIQRAQREFRMTGLGVVDCSLQVYSSVRWHFENLFRTFRMNGMKVNAATPTKPATVEPHKSD